MKRLSAVPTFFPEGENHFLLEGPAGPLETITLSAKGECRGLGVVCHPHPLHEGSMHNKVVTTVARAFSNKGLHTVRFNFRGVGKSAGAFGNSVGEVADLMAVLAWLNKIMPNQPLVLAGFSFGAYIAAMGATQTPCSQLWSIAPAVPNQPYDQLPAMTCPWMILQGEQDEIIDPQTVYDWFETRKQQATAPMTLVKFSDTSHFFHGKLILLRDQVEDALLL